MNCTTSVVIPVYNEKKYILNCIESVVKQTYPSEKMELLIVDGMSTDGTRDMIEEFILGNEFSLKIKLISNPGRTAPIGMNLGIHQSQGEYIVRMDAHSDYPCDYVESLLKWKVKLGASNVGAVCLTRVYHSTSKSAAIAKVLVNRYGVGDSAFRIGVEKPMEVDTVPFGCYEKQLLLEVGLYDERLVRNQDIELNKRIRKRGGHIYLIPSIVVTYFARETYRDIAKNNYGNGMWNILTVYYTKDIQSLSLRHFIPFIFLLSLIAPIVLSLIWSPFISISALSFLAYNALILGQSFKMNAADTTIWDLIKAFYTLHFSYGWGSFVGIFKVLKLKLFGEK